MWYSVSSRRSQHTTAGTFATPDARDEVEQKRAGLWLQWCRWWVLLLPRGLHCLAWCKRPSRARLALQHRSEDELKQLQVIVQQVRLQC